MKTQSCATQGEAGPAGNMMNLGLFCWNNPVMGKEMSRRVTVQAVFHELSVPIKWQWLFISSMALVSSWCVSGICLPESSLVTCSRSQINSNPLHPKSSCVQDWETWWHEHWPSSSRSGRLIGKVLWLRAWKRRGCSAHTGVCQIALDKVAC